MGNTVWLVLSVSVHIRMDALICSHYYPCPYHSLHCGNNLVRVCFYQQVCHAFSYGCFDSLSQCGTLLSCCE